LKEKIEGMQNSSDSRYTDEEARSIIQRALELEHRGGEAGAESGVSYAELSSVAEEAGISPEALRRAAAELRQESTETPVRPVGRLAGLLGAPTRLEQRLEIDRALSEDELQHLYASLRRLTGDEGSGQVGSRFLTWTSGYQTQMRSGRVSSVDVQVGDDRTDITLHERLEAVAGGLYGGLVGGVGGGVGFGVGFGVGLGELGSLSFALLFAGGSLIGSFLLARLIYPAVVRYRRGVLQRIMARIREICGE
jgi:hypothetical protein